MQITTWQSKIPQNVFYFWDNGLLFLSLNLLREIVHIATGILVMGSQRVNKQC